MRIGPKILAVLLSAATVFALPEPSSNYLAVEWSPNDILVRDVAIIGGGATGTYAAIRLGELGKSVVLIESKDRLGGHTETYTDPTTKTNIELGVLEYHDIDIVKNFFGRFNISLIKVSGLGGAPGPTDFVDFRTGTLVPGYTPSDPTMAMGIYASQVAQYPYLETGFDLPNPVPSDLLLTFSDFITKYGISAAANIIFNFNQGNGDFLKLPTIYVMKLLTLSVLQGIQTGFLTTAKTDNGAIRSRQ